MSGWGKFIVFEGIDGCGSTTQADLLKRWFDRKSQMAFYTKEPTEGPIGFVIRLFMSKRVGSSRSDGKFEPLDESTLALAFAADRMDHLHNGILPNLQKGVTVIADRFYLSSLAYQSLSADYEWVKQINSKCLRPDITIFLDVPAAVCKKRMEIQRWHVELYEEEERLEMVRSSYKRAIDDLLGKGEMIFTIDGNKPLQDVHKEVVSLVQKTLSGKPPLPRGKQIEITDFLKVDENSVPLMG